MIDVPDTNRNVLALDGSASDADPDSALSLVFCSKHPLARHGCYVRIAGRPFKRCAADGVTFGVPDAHLQQRSERYPNTLADVDTVSRNWTFKRLRFLSP